MLILMHVMALFAQNLWENANKLEINLLICDKRLSSTELNKNLYFFILILIDKIKKLSFIKYCIFYVYS